MMRRAFVIQLGPETKPEQRHLDGWVEDVDTGRDARFRSTEELLTFLSDCFDLAQRSEPEPPEDEGASS
jgi:hypothetical protein